MARASARISQIEGNVNVGSVEGAEVPTYGASADVQAQSPFGPGSVGRRALYVWGGATLWLLLVWRAVEGY